MPPEDEWTILRLLTWTADFLKRKGSGSPRPDAEILLAHVLGYERVQLYTHYADVVGDRGRSDYRDLVRRRAEGAPVAYLVGRKEFYSLRFDVDPAVLIPRPETEFVVVEFLDAMKAVEAPTAVDVGTGSGCIAVACARFKPDARWLAVDLSADALAVAAGNARRHDVSDRIEFLQGDLLAPAVDRGPFDAIVSNPPYVASAEIDRLDADVKDHEPALALDGGPDGLAVYRRLVERAASLLKPGGRLILEIGFDQDEAVGALVAESGAFELLPTVRDLQNLARVVRAVRKA